MMLLCRLDITLIIICKLFESLSIKAGTPMSSLPFPPLTRTQINLLEGFHRKSIRYMQLLPQRTAVSVVCLLIGAYPVEAEIHLRQLSLLYSLLSCHNEKIKEVVNCENRNDPDLVQACTL
jgi:hypothetical protein